MKNLKRLHCQEIVWNPFPNSAHIGIIISSLSQASSIEWQLNVGLEASPTVGRLNATCIVVLVISFDIQTRSAMTSFWKALQCLIVAPRLLQNIARARASFATGLDYLHCWFANFYSRY